MKKIILYIAASLDGRIAEPDGGLEWLTGFPNPEKTDYGYKDLLASVDTVIMGGRTYRELLNMDVIWPYIIIAKNNGWIKADPFVNYKIRIKKVDRGYLQQEEIVSINCTNIVDVSKFPVFASAHSRGILPNKLLCIGKTVKSIFPKISVVSKSLNQS